MRLNEFGGPLLDEGRYKTGLNFWFAKKPFDEYCNDYEKYCSRRINGYFVMYEDESQSEVLGFGRAFSGTIPGSEYCTDNYMEVDYLENGYYTNIKEMDKRYIKTHANIFKFYKNDTIKDEFPEYFI